jgi:hypothetical protein
MKFKCEVRRDEFPGGYKLLKKHIAGWLKFYGNLLEMDNWRIYIRYVNLDPSDYSEEELEDGKIPQELHRRHAGGIATQGEYKWGELTLDLDVIAKLRNMRDVISIIRHELLHTQLYPMQSLQDLWAATVEDQEHARLAVEYTCVQLDEYAFWKVLEDQLAPQWLLDGLNE